MIFKRVLRIFSAACILGLLAAAIPFTPVMAATGTIYASASFGTAGSTVTVSGVGFTTSTQAIVYFDGVAQNAGGVSGGAFSILLVIPASATVGTGHVISATVDGFSDTVANTIPFTVTITTAYTLSAASGYVGDAVTVTGSGFTPGVVSFYWDGAGTSFASLTASSAGALSGTITIPAAIRGTHSISTPGVTAKSFLVNSKIVLVPISGSVGDTVSVTGSGFAASSPVTISVDGQTITATSPLSIITTATGGFPSCSFSMPSAASGPRTVRATDSGGNAEATFTVGPKITLSPTSGVVGDNVIISGNGFSALRNLTVQIELTSGTDVYSALTTIPAIPSTDLTGLFTGNGISFAIPSMAGGVHKVKVTDQAGNFAIATLTVLPQISLTPISGTVGTQITVSGSGFGPGLGVDIFWDASTTRITTTTASSSGTISGVQFISPTSAKGSHTVKAQDTAANSATASFSTTPKIVLTPASGGYGDSITVTFTGFTASSTVTSIGLLSGTTQYTLSTTPATVPIDANGGGSAAFSVINVYNGNWTVQASDSSGGSAQATLAITQKIALGTTTGAAGDIITVTGTGFAVGKSITMKYNGVALATLPATVTSDTSGAFPCQFSVPETTAGAITVTASDGTNVATASFTVTVKATISKTTTQTDPGYVGMDMTISGTGFQSNPTITVTFDSTTITGATVTSGANGSFTATFKIPTTPAGNHIIHVTDGTTTKDFAFFMDSTAPVAPTLLLPIDKFKPKQPVPFSWNAVTDPSGLTYTMQISLDPAFGATGLIEHTGLTTTTYTMTVAEKLKSSKTPYYWRVRATDKAGNVGAWSTSNTFTIGFIWPWWIIHVWYGLGIVVALIFGLWLGRRMAYQSY